MGSHFYKKSQISQLKAFCTTVECDNNMTRASEKMYCAVSSVSSKITSLEKYLGYELFHRKINQLSLTEAGKEFYVTAKNIITNFDEIFDKNKQIITIKKPSFASILKNKTVNYFQTITRFIKKFNNKVSIRKKYIILTVLFGLLLGFYYLFSTNYFFDRKLYSLANPLLREVMQEGEYRISKDNPDRTEGVQVSLDVFQMLTKLINDKNYKNIVASKFLFAEHPMTVMRFTGNEKIDKIFNTKKAIDRSTEKIYLLATQAFKHFKILLEEDKNFRSYSIYYDPLNNCVQCDVLFENIKKYPNQLFAIKAEKIKNFANVNGWIIKYRKYYYLTLITNISPNHDQSNIQEQYIFWKKLTLNELMHYDNGSYWKLIKDYNIQID